MLEGRRSVMVLISPPHRSIRSRSSYQSERVMVTLYTTKGSLIKGQRNRINLIAMTECRNGSTISYIYTYNGLIMNTNTASCITAIRLHIIQKKNHTPMYGAITYGEVDKRRRASQLTKQSCIYLAISFAEEKD